MYVCGDALDGSFAWLREALVKVISLGILRAALVKSFHWGLARACEGFFER